MLSFPVHPRYSRMFLIGHELNCVSTIALVAAITQERHLLRKSENSQMEHDRELLLGKEAESDFFVLIRAWLYAQQHGPEKARRLGIRYAISQQIAPVFQQFVGINVIFYYSNVLWQAVGFGEGSSFTITVITSVTNILTTLIAIALIDKIGRRPLLLIGSTGMAITLGTMALVFGTATLVDGKPHLGGVAGPIALIAANLFVVAFGMSWGPVVWVLLGEMFPNRIRAAALGLAAAGQWTANWLITVTFPGLRHQLGIAYGFYALCAVLSFLFVWRWVEETKGKSLEDMHQEAWVHESRAAT